MIVIQANAVFLAVAIGTLGAIAMRAVDAAYTGDNNSVQLLLRLLALAIVTIVSCVVFGAKVGSVAHAAEQVGAGYGDLAGYELDVSEPPF